jgi:hypothetical protein
MSKRYKYTLFRISDSSVYLNYLSTLFNYGVVQIWSHSSTTSTRPHFNFFYFCLILYLSTLVTVVGRTKGFDLLTITSTKNGKFTVCTSHQKTISGKRERKKHYS